MTIVSKMSFEVRWVIDTAFVSFIPSESFPTYLTELPFDMNAIVKKLHVVWQSESATEPCAISDSHLIFQDGQYFFIEEKYVVVFVFSFLKTK